MSLSYDKNDDVLCLIPARGGSKGIPRKNIVDLGGKPLISWSIEVALLSGIFQSVVVSTDDTEIADISKSCGAKVPFMRPRELAQDTTLQIEVIKHALNWFDEIENRRFKYVFLLQPTSPFRTTVDIVQAWKTYIQFQKGTLISVLELENVHQSNLYLLQENKTLSSLEYDSPNPSGTLRQNLKSLFWRNGSIYIFSSEDILTENRLITSPIIPFIMPRERSINIDSPSDLISARKILLNAGK
jgi:CMP-N,N'-diacetyllegionaminic acid synthase